jgi:hypothetical protein
MPEAKIEELIQMAQDWKFKGQLPNAQYVFK